MKNVIKKLVKAVICLVLALVLAVVILFTYLTVREYRPADTEVLGTPYYSILPQPSIGDELTVVTWNVGCGTLGDNADFFMDYGEMVYTADRERVRKNLEGITGTLIDIDPDIMMLQETDVDASRSYHTDETEVIVSTFPLFD